MKKLIFALTFLSALAIGSHFFFKYKNTHLVFSSLKNFPQSSETNSYEAAHPLTYFGPNKFKKAVLLLHGFGSAPIAFEILAQKLKEEGIPYYAPLITGFGLSDFHLLDAVLSSDWIRDVFFGFDLLSSIADEVDVIGHSNGGCLALILAMKHPVQKLILLDPFLSSTAPWLLQDAMETPVLNSSIQFLMPVAMKPHYPGRVGYADLLNPEAHPFKFSGAPTQAFQALQITNKKAIKASPYIKEWVEKKKNPQSSLFVLYGREDKTVNIPGMLAYFTKEQIPAQIRSYPCTAHDILADYKAEEVMSDILYILKNGSLDPATEHLNNLYTPIQCP